ncbi:hypothetical protein [Aneurinibacillus terranovensis]|uniref:hypothetical protein n=1 Tax=Aneurinibacillus terranovensis TaxID=278991 RepID=UPI0012DE8899|nr:hypothetical protein [Aneurinibacillus terranovensis]
MNRFVKHVMRNGWNPLKVNQRPHTCSMSGVGGIASLRDDVLDSGCPLRRSNWHAHGSG